MDKRSYLSDLMNDIMDPYLQYTLHTTSEIVLALLAQLPFEAFEEQNSITLGYIKARECDDISAEKISQLCNQYDVAFSVTKIEPRNWNAEWESNFSPVDVGSFCSIRADFHEAAVGFDHVINLQPKMAFGTGHHETTYMMIDSMSTIDFNKRRVLDYGCGTGILAILAQKLGAETVTAVDIEEESYQNTLENSSANNVQLSTVLCGTIAKVTGKYDVILANINRNVLLATCNDVYSRLAPGGTLLLSGILEQDQAPIMDKYNYTDLRLNSSQQRGNWMCLMYTRDPSPQA